MRKRKRQELEKKKKSIEELYKAMEDISYKYWIPPWDARPLPPYYHWSATLGVEQKALPAPKPKPPDGLTPPPERNHMIHHG